MQTLSYHLTTNVARCVPTQIIKWGGSQRWLPLFILYALVRSLWALGTKQVELIHIGDPVLAPLGLFLRFVGRRPVVVNVHGLDVIYPNRLYQAIVLPCVKKLDFVICISEYTRQLCLSRGIRAERTAVVPPGIDTSTFHLTLTEAEQDHWIRQWGIESRPKHILLTVGRLVPRKGIYFFVSQVLPRLRERRKDWIYLIVGDGPERGPIESAIRAQDLHEMVRLLGQVPDDELAAAYAMADVFVMPNVSVPGNPEGLGLVTLEALASGVPVVAADLEGIGEALGGKDDGTLVKPGDWSAFVEAINAWFDRDETAIDREQRRQRTHSRFAWSRVVSQYMEIFQAVIKEHNTRRGKQNACCN